MDELEQFKEQFKKVQQSKDPEAIRQLCMDAFSMMLQQLELSLTERNTHKTHCCTMAMYHGLQALRQVCGLPIIS